jgi:hypothetical protein
MKISVRISILSGLFLTSVALGALASTPEASPVVPMGAPTFFSQLQAQYVTGTQPSWAPLENKIDSGRCFTRLAPDLAVAAYLLVHAEMVDPGPLGSPALTCFAQVDSNPDIEASYFDQDSVSSQDSQIKVQALPLLLSDERTYSLTFPQSLTSMHFRASQNTIIGSGENELGETTVLCYFFKIH